MVSLLADPGSAVTLTAATSTGPAPWSRFLQESLEEILYLLIQMNFGLLRIQHVRQPQSAQTLHEGRRTIHPVKGCRGTR
ncbi:hypothetical protein GGI1_21679 [Acidithiobacillus sp. GGI-221]|nr:hypothetical protein GGI1_21679 [Acidithiobacillus sp. GGI-221]